MVYYNYSSAWNPISASQCLPLNMTVIKSGDPKQIHATSCQDQRGQCENEMTEGRHLPNIWYGIDAERKGENSALG